MKGSSACFFGGGLVLSFVGGELVASVFGGGVRVLFCFLSCFSFRFLSLVSFFVSCVVFCFVGVRSVLCVWGFRYRKCLGLRVALS